MATKIKFQLVTQGNFDGFVCAVLLKELDIIDNIKFIYPRDVQNDKVKINSNDITTYLPYSLGAHLVFEHRMSEIIRISGQKPDNYIIDPHAPSVSRVVFNYYGGKKAFPNVSEEMIQAVDKINAAQFTREEILSPKGAQFTREEILSPKGWVLFSFMTVPRSGLGRMKPFRISCYDFRFTLIDFCKNHTIEEILELPDVKERIDLFFQHQKVSIEQIKKCSKVHGNVVVVDLRHEDEIFLAANHLHDALYPECNVFIHVLWGLQKNKTVLVVNKSILERSAKTHIGELMLEYGGAGHKNAGTCDVSNEEAERILSEIINKIQR